MIFDSSTMTIGAFIALACIILGSILLTAKYEFLKTSAFFNGGKHRKGAALIIYRFSGIQMVSMGVLLVIAIIGFALEIPALAWPCIIIIVFLPVACSSYMKRSKRFK